MIVLDGHVVEIAPEKDATEQLCVDQLVFDENLRWVDNVDETATELANMDASKFFEELEAERGGV